MNKELMKDNFYKAANSSWLEKAVIPADQPAISAFLELHLGIEKLLMDLAKGWEKDQTGLSANMKKFVAIYKKANNFELREKEGSTALAKVIAKVEELKSLKDLETNFKELKLVGIPTPFDFSVMQDFMNSNNQVLYSAGAGTILPDTSYYQNEEQKNQMLGLWQAVTTGTLKLYGLSDEEVAKLISDTILFDSLLVPVTKSSVEAADYVKLYNPLTVKEIKEKVHSVDVVKVANELVNAEVEKIVFTHIPFVDEFDKIISEENFEIIKSWIKLNTYLAFASEFNDALRVAGGAFRRALSGIKEAQAKEKAAFYKAYNYLNQIVGLHYGLTYFGEAAKKDVEKMVHEMIAVYKERIEANTWLQEETKAKAIKKLSAVTVLVGYPDELPSYYDEFEFDKEDSLLDINLKFTKLRTLDNYNKYNKEPNRNLWGMPASMVNAYYSPTNNQIVFPAAILQEPYYSLNQHPSANFGGIGAVIAHEISHAFDNNGAKFDEFGSLNNWWTEEDLKAFADRAEAMVTLFDGVETGFGKCNGKLTVSENIADSGGLRAALEASKAHSNHDYDEFFTNWARVWRNKASLEYSKLLLTVDVHGPSILRANMQLANLSEFQDHYKLTKEDKMYLDKDKMVSIW